MDKPVYRKTTNRDWSIFFLVSMLTVVPQIGGMIIQDMEARVNILCFSVLICLLIAYALMASRGEQTEEVIGYVKLDGKK